jgi:hypothetical protein
MIDNRTFDGRIRLVEERLDAGGQPRPRRHPTIMIAGSDRGAPDDVNSLLA